MASLYEHEIASGFVVNSGGILSVTQGGTTVGAVVNNGGFESIYDGIASGTVLNSGGIEMVSGGISGGPPYEGAVSGTIVSSGGMLIVGFNGLFAPPNSAVSTTVLSGGIVYVASGYTVSSRRNEFWPHAQIRCYRDGE